MPKLFAIVSMQDGLPKINLKVTPVKGWVLCDQIGNFGAYLFSGTITQLAALNALPEVFGIVGVTESEIKKWAELDKTISATMLTKINNWLSARGYPNIPAEWTYRQVITAVYKHFNSIFDLSGFDIIE